MIEAMTSSDFIKVLQPNCVTVSTRRRGEILIGCPPEIVKWFIRRGRPIPSVIVLPRDFLLDNTLNIEPEFPIYGNFFAQKQRATLIGTGDQLRRIRTVLRESFFGPKEAQEGKGEREFLRARTKDGKMLELTDIVKLLPFRRDQKSVDIDGVTIKAIRAGCFEIWEEGVRLGEVDTTSFTLPTHPPDLFKEKPLEPPTFGVSFVGAGSGFSPFRRTTSFVLWIDGKGVFVDPVIDPWVELNRLGIHDVDVPSVLLTHCHADHDAGMIRAVIHQRRLRLMTSRVVFGSFLRKTRALTGCDIRQHLDFVEINPGDTVTVENARIVASSAFHSIPTIRFEVVFRDSELKRDMKIAYSADTCLDRAKIETMYRRRIIDRKRLNELLHFGLDADLFIHEAGREALHTAVEELRHFPEQVRKRLILVHTGNGRGDLEGLRVAQEGETVELIPSRKSLVDRVRLLASNSIFEAVNKDTLNRIAERSLLVPFKAGQNIVSQGEKGDRFYVITLGKAKVVVDDSIRVMLEKGDYFGEISLLKGNPRNATVQAISDGSALALDRETFLKLVQEEPSVDKRLRNVLRVRPLVSQLAFSRDLSADQLARLSIRFTRCTRYKGDRVVEQNKRGDAFFVLASGRATVLVRDTEGGERIVAKLAPGDVFGEIALLKNIPRTATVEITSDSAELLQSKERDFRTLMESIPSLSFYLNRISSKRLQKLSRKKRGDSHDPILKGLA
jgi:CRP-like cAMP-binding protein/ribonuclease BN (tRNA processing enzyme)